MTTTISIPDIRTIMPDGSIFAGVSPDTGRPMYATPKDHTGFFGLKHLFTVRGAFAAASKLKSHGRNDWRVPSRAELNVLFRNRAAMRRVRLPPGGTGRLRATSTTTSRGRSASATDSRTTSI